ncbi:MAG: hypothetical protein J1E64_08350 [Acetatifactor sp.]|nr:hypothetical protein [Acetatifactor sp.]
MKVNAKKALLIGLASSTLFGMTGCTVENNMEGDVYGPPPYLEDTVGDAAGSVINDVVENDTVDTQKPDNVSENEKTL